LYQFQKYTRSSYVGFAGTDIASSFVVPAEAVVSSLKHCRSGSSAPVFVAIDTRSAVAFGRCRLPTALHVPVLAEDAVKLASLILVVSFLNQF
jgi:hypothetical protein